MSEQKGAIAHGTLPTQRCKHGVLLVWIRHCKECEREEELAEIAELEAEIQRLRAALEESKRYKNALRKIVCLNIQMPDEVFNIANDALEEENA